MSTVREDKDRGLNRLVRIREEHIHLFPQLRITVKLAAQVLSSSMANALMLKDAAQYSSTAILCRNMDKWFDCLNGRHLNQARDKRKPELGAYFDKNDWRFHWLENDFLGWLNSWENEIDNQPGLSASEKRSLILSYQTMEDLKITTKSFTELLPLLLADDGSLFVLPEKLNQDKLELLFGKLRRSLGDLDNPTVYEAMYRLLTLLLAGSVTATPRNANAIDFDAGHGFQLNRRR